jgi:hypothetical protein
VLDPTKAVIPGATVTLTDNATQTAKTSTSSGDGTYQFNELPPGTYTLKATANGFQQNTVSNVTVAAETPRSLDITMQTGQETQTVNVNADSVPLLQSSDASIGTTIDSSEIDRLPIFGADPYELLRTAPGITGDGARAGNGTAVFLPNGAGPGGSNSGVFQTENQVQISADGQRELADAWRRRGRLAQSGGGRPDDDHVDLVRCQSRTQHRSANSDCDKKRHK